MQSIWRIGPTFMADAAADPAGGPAESGRWLADGYGFGLTSGVHSAYGRVVAHSGGLPGFGTHVRWLPDHGVGIVAFANLTYAAAWDAISRAFGVLTETGGLQARVAQPSPALAAARDTALALYDDWDDAALTNVAADNLFLDVPIERRRQARAVLREECGARVGVEPPRLSGALRGVWRLTCERGEVDVTIALSPALSSRVQTLQYDRVET
jgi:hypothetical protein